MATTAEKSTQVTALDAGTRIDALSYGGEERCFPVTFTQVGAGATGSTIKLARIPAGRWLVLWKKSYIAHGAMGTGVTADIGMAAYTAPDGTTVAAADNFPDDDIDVAAAGVKQLGSDLTAVTGLTSLLNSRDGVDIIWTSNTIPDTALVNGHITAVHCE
jgi:hypothetical protein